MSFVPAPFSSATFTASSYSPPSKDEVRKNLKGWIQVSVEALNLGTKVQYFVAKRNPDTRALIVRDNGTVRREYRPGGYVKSKDLTGRETDEQTGTPYWTGRILLTNRGKTWPVHLDQHCLFFREPTKKMIKAKYLQEIQIRDRKILKLRSEVKQLNLENVRLKSRLELAMRRNRQ